MAAVRKLLPLRRDDKKTQREGWGKGVQGEKKGSSVLIEGVRDNQQGAEDRRE